jgi:hypothetical protein
VCGCPSARDFAQGPAPCVIEPPSAARFVIRKCWLRRWRHGALTASSGNGCAATITKSGRQLDQTPLAPASSHQQTTSQSARMAPVARSALADTGPTKSPTRWRRQAGTVPSMREFVMTFFQWRTRHGKGRRILVRRGPSSALPSAAVQPVENRPQEVFRTQSPRHTNDQSGSRNGAAANTSGPFRNRNFRGSGLPSGAEFHPVTSGLLHSDAPQQPPRRTYRGLHGERTSAVSAVRSSSITHLTPVAASGFIRAQRPPRRPPPSPQVFALQKNFPMPNRIMRPQNGYVGNSVASASCSAGPRHRAECASHNSAG